MFFAKTQASINTFFKFARINTTYGVDIKAITARSII